jgi:ribulose-5-phosphate 4-epimerase/fuculose-1-phosphate aldolase
MKFTVIKNDSSPLRDSVAEALVHTCLRHGHELSSAENGIQFVLNLTDTESPQFFRRKAQSIFVFSIVAVDNPGGDLRSLCYSTLVRSLSNMVICAVPRNGRQPAAAEPKSEVYFTTPEAGFYSQPFDPEDVYGRFIPIAGAHFAIGNQFFEDLPPRYWQPSPAVEKLREYGQELDRLGVLPAPFPLRQVLSEELIQQLYKLFEMKGLSYGNLSTREHIDELGQTTFWMTARGINKARISQVGKDVLLVKGFDYARGNALVSVPPVYDSRARVSVDAVEHELIYRTFPEVGAIVHVHAWMNSVPSTRQNFPCGTQELAEEVTRLLQHTENPAQTAVGLKNHGLTITGPSLDRIFDNIRGKLLKEVPMF